MFLIIGQTKLRCFDRSKCNTWIGNNSNRHFSKMENNSMEVDSVITGYHVYKTECASFVSESLQAKQEPDNIKDNFLFSSSRQFRRLHNKHHW